MGDVREFCGYVLGLAFCAFAVILCAFAWFGLDDMFGWQWALCGIAISLVARINFALVVGLYYYAFNILGWPMPESIAFALPGLMLIVPSFAIAIFGMIVGTAARR